MVQMLAFQQQHIALLLVQVEHKKFKPQICREEMEEIRSLELHLQQLIMKQLTSVPLVVVEEVLSLLHLSPERVVVVVAVAVAKTQVLQDHHHQDFLLADLHIHYHMELLLGMAVMVVLELLDLQTSVMVVVAVVPVLMEVPNLTEANPLARVLLEEHLLLEETPTPSQVVAVEDVGTLIQLQRMVE
jgi:hypothetical protein